MDLSFFRLVGQFHERYGFKPMSQMKPEEKEEILRLKLIHIVEETREIVDAIDRNSPVDILDGIVDLVYVALGLAWFYGFNFSLAFNRVHEANMRKMKAMRPEDSKRGSAFDVIKPPNWKPADISDCIP